MQRLLGLVFCVAIATAGCDVRVGDNGVSVDIARGRASDEWLRTYSLLPGGRLEIVNENGGISAEPAVGPQVEVRATREVRGGSDDESRALLQKLTMLEEVTADRVKIEGRGNALQASAGRRAGVSIVYQLRLPRGLVVSLQTQNGGIALENVDGQIAARTVNGGVVGHGVAGALQAATVNGGVQVAMRSVTGDVSLLSVNGGVRLTLPPGVRATVEASAVNGGVTVDEALRLETTDNRRLHVAGTLNGGGPTINLQTTNGGVRLAGAAAEPPNGASRSDQ
jgi:hypothetical protein